MSGKSSEFEKELNQIFEYAERKNLYSITIRSGNFHRLVGDYPGPNHRMPICCEILKKAMLPGDRILHSPQKGYGANLIIEFLFPRNSPREEK